jgi:hypothetical protein
MEQILSIVQHLNQSPPFSHIALHGTSILRLLFLKYPREASGGSPKNGKKGGGGKN